MSAFSFSAKLKRASVSSVPFDRMLRTLELMAAFFLLITSALIGACGAPSLSHSAAPDTPDAAMEIYSCGEGQLIFVERAGYGGPSILRYGAEVERLRLGARSGEYHGETLSFYEDLGGARFEASGVSLSCKRDARARALEAAIRDDLRFIGFGNEPFISVRVFGDRYELELDAGAQRLKGSLEPLSADASRSLRLSLESADERILMAIEATACEDGMSGARFSHRFGLIMGERRFSGCGFAFELPISASTSLAGASRSE